jgi:hypothetical protein
VPKTGEYTFHFRVASTATTNIEVRENGVRLQTLPIPSSGGWQSWKTLKTNVTLTAGKHKLRIFTSRGSFNFNWFEITNAGQNPTSVIEISQANSRVYPNPVNDQLFIESTNLKGKTEVSILDLSGRVLSTEVFTGETAKMEIDFRTFNSGSYIVRTKNSGNISSHLVVK